MYKTKKIINIVKKIKSDICTFNNKIKFVPYGSFYRYECRYINDIDIHCLFKQTEKISDEIDTILKIINYFENYKDIVYKKYYIGHINYYYRNTFNINYFKKLEKNRIINNENLENIAKLINTNVEHNIIKKKIDCILEIPWDKKDINNKSKIYNNIKYNLKNSIERDNFIWFNLILKNKNSYIPIEFIIMTNSDFNNAISKKNIYTGCKLAKSEFIINNYYNFLKRLRSCYCIKKKKQTNNIYLNDMYNKINDFLKNQEIYISKYHEKKAKYLVENKLDKIKKLNKNFNMKFKNFAIFIYNSGVENQIIF